MSTLTGSCACTWGSGTQPHPTSCHRVLAHSAFGISCTETPVGVEKGVGLLSEENSGSLILATVGIFTPWELVKTTNPGSIPGLRFKSWFLSIYQEHITGQGGSEARFGVVVSESALISVVAVKLCSQSSGVRAELKLEVRSPAQGWELGMSSQRLNI